MKNPDTMKRRLKTVGRGLLCALLAIAMTASLAWPAENEAAPAGKSYILILFLYDLNKTYHVLRVGAYTSAENCQTQGRNAIKALNRGKVQNQNFMCLEADLPY